MTSSSVSYYDRFISIFSPEGKLYQVEYALKAVRSGTNTALAIRARDGAVVISIRRIQDPLIRPETVTFLHRVTKETGVCLVGRAADAKVALTQARQEAAKYWYENGEMCPCSIIAQRAADHAQLATQNAGTRLLAVSFLLISMELMDEGDYRPRIFKIDPSGCCFPHHAAVVGQKEKEITLELERRLKTASKPFMEMHAEEAGQVGLAALQAVNQQRYHSKDIEIGMVHEDHRDFVILSGDDVERWLMEATEQKEEDEVGRSE